MCSRLLESSLGVPSTSDSVVYVFPGPTRWLGWKTSTPLRDGVAAAIEWYKRFGIEQTFTHLAIGQDKR